MNVADLPGLYFIDTNVLVYTFDPSIPDKQATAQAIVAHALSSRRGLISTQVIQEFLNVALRKFAQPMTVPEARLYLQQVLLPLCGHYPDPPFFDYALLVQVETGFAWFDALIVAAAGASGCTHLVSEDLQHGRTIRGVTITNPFVP